jgi:spore maturation protein CgeB
VRIAYFTHSLASCWNHGNAHFLRGVLRELIARGHEVRALEPANPWSLETSSATTATRGWTRGANPTPT